MMRETIDESIDRVAAAMTAVPADPGFAARVDARLATPHASVAWPWIWQWIAAPAAAAAVLAAAIVFGPAGRDEDEAALRPQGAQALLPATAGPVQAVPLQASAHMQSTGGASARARPGEHVEDEADDPFATRIAALSAPAALSIDALSLESLSIAPVDVADLDLPEIEVGDMPGGEPKEQ